jgi:hypothetical protein
VLCWFTLITKIAHLSVEEEEEVHSTFRLRREERLQMEEEK